MVDFAQVIKVRDRKAEKAQRAEGAAMAACDAARQRVDEAREAMEQFAEECKGLEIRLLNDLLKTKITVHDVAVVRDKLDKAQAHAKQLVEAVQQAKAEVEQHEQIVERMRQNRLVAEGKLRRITEFDKRLSEIEATRLVMEEDARMDEFAEIISARRNT